MLYGQNRNPDRQENGLPLSQKKRLGFYEIK